MPAFSLTPVQGFPQTVSEEFPNPLLFSLDDVMFNGPIQIVNFTGGTVTERETGILDVTLGGGGAAGVITLNTLDGHVNLVAGPNVSINVVTGNSIMISATGGGGGGPCGSCAVIVPDLSEFGSHKLSVDIEGGRVDVWRSYSLDGYPPETKMSLLNEELLFRAFDAGGTPVVETSLQMTPNGPISVGAVSDDSISVKIMGLWYQIPCYQS